jgi:1,4-dihydroxy-2-naphthoyl-CoA synthase
MIKCEVADHLARIAFARPGEGNAFTGNMIRQLRDAVRDCDTRADILTLAAKVRISLWAATARNRCQHPPSTRSA